MFDQVDQGLSVSCFIRVLLYWNIQVYNTWNALLTDIKTIINKQKNASHYIPYPNSLKQQTYDDFKRFHIPESPMWNLSPDDTIPSLGQYHITHSHRYHMTTKYQVLWNLSAADVLLNKHLFNTFICALYGLICSKLINIYSRLSYMYYMDLSIVRL